ncbi:MAG: BatD family protein, partial [Balneolaceae bacterium]|nr:BatD family protein [Balneolaceae bacterium]
MKRTGKPFLLIFLLLALFSTYAGSSRAQSADINVVSTVSQTTVYTGERISLSVEVSGDFSNVSRPTLPDFTGFRLLSNNPSTSRSYSFVNGKTSSSYSYTYFLIAQEEGNYTIPSITVSIDGNEFNTDPIDVQIIDRNSSANESGAENRPEIFLRMEVSDRNPVPGQQLITDVILYFKDGLEVNSYQPVPGWKAEGFWKEELENTERPRAESTIIDGVRYRKARLLQFALFPTKTGELSISPYEIIVSVRAASSRDDPFSSFFGGFGSNQRQVELRTDPVQLNVEPLPDIDPSSYTGAVGSFSINRKISTREAIVGESIEIETTIRGTGNVPLITKPEYELPDGLEIYDPQQASSLNRRNQQISGSKVFTDIVIARTPGTYTIPEATLAYFDPSRNTYVRESLPSLSFTVLSDPNAQATAEQQQSFSVKPVTGLASWTTATSPGLTGRWWFWAGIFFPLLVLGAGYWQKTYR